MTLDAVLSGVVPGRIVRLSLTGEQKQAFRDRDGQLALSVVRHLLASRRVSDAPPEFPLVEAVFQQVAGRLGQRVGIKRSRTLIRRLVAAEVIVVSGSYRQKYRDNAARSGFRVTLYRLAVAAAGVVRRRVCGAPRLQLAVGRRGSVKQDVGRRWWQHELFGDVFGLPPPGFTKKQLRRMRSADEQEPTWR